MLEKRTIVFDIGSMLILLQTESSEWTGQIPGSMFQLSLVGPIKKIWDKWYNLPMLYTCMALERPPVTFPPKKYKDPDTKVAVWSVTGPIGLSDNSVHELVSIIEIR